jgi:hypothetical protein
VDEALIGEGSTNNRTFLLNPDLPMGRACVRALFGVGETFDQKKLIFFSQNLLTKIGKWCIINVENSQMNIQRNKENSRNHQLQRNPLMRPSITERVRDCLREILTF